ncbi:hypothetical protein M409DRAFT_16645 [Zasmidium cellare ATCC 36951]|uniref:F-box domain-containing protein n=1 Tax=Zasmidium cellare ATCC 36951 TaxID=1080233 RepID=A0A6A6D0Y5_ZASCE|nr:uncharacterized protein M409DRAFT_16645 [Zasmidium cellare ATCC 36951]KAF2172683.1 hypothetical protein M409DRAFT_16645 [Zasmidium cellare ATCC 36951]
MANVEVDSAHKPPTTILTLPQELQDDILDRVLLSTTVHIEEGTRRDFSPDDEDMFGPLKRKLTNTDISRLSDLPHEIASLKLVCRQFAKTVGGKWHSKVTYHFPSTISFIDILRQWPASKVSSLRYAYIRNFDCIITNDYGFMGMDISSALSFFPGLQLDTLTVDNMALAPSGQNVANRDAGYSIIHFELERLPFTNGWKTLEYLSGPLCLLPSQQRESEAKVAQHKTEKEECDFHLDIVGTVRPQLGHLAEFRERIADGSGVPPWVAAQLVELDEWYAKHPEAGKPGEFPAKEVKEVKEVTVRVQRGSKANYAEDGSGSHNSDEELLRSSNWMEVRKGEDKIIDDSMHTPFRSRAEQLK